MNNNNNNNNNDDNKGWTTVGQLNKNKNKKRRDKKKKKIQIAKQKQEYFEKQKQKRFEEHYKYQYENKDDWRQKRIALIKQKELEEYKLRKITSEFSKAIQFERTKANISVKELSLKIMVSEKNLIEYENGTKCPNSLTVVKLRQLFCELPRKYFTIG